jgi:choline dehydrogenase-like flavoprotein
MMYVRGNRRDYDRWAEMGNYGWSYDEVLPYFLKSQYQTDRRVLHSSAGFHATGGPLPVSNFPYHTKLAEAYLEAASSLGFRTANDINGEDQFAFTFPQVKYSYLKCLVGI